MNCGGMDCVMGWRQLALAAGRGSRWWWRVSVRQLDSQAALYCCSKELGLQRCDELNSWYKFSNEALVIRQKKIASGLGGACQMDCVSRGHSLCSPDPGIMLRSSQVKRNYFRNDFLQESARFIRCADGTCSIYTGKHFSEREGACD